MKEKTPFRVYMRVAINVFFTLLLVWFFSFRILQLFFPFNDEIQFYLYGSFIFSFIVSLSLVKKGIKDEIKDLNKPFSIVALDPEIKIEHEKITKMLIIKRFFSSIALTILLTLPVTIIGIIKTVSGELSFHDMGIFFKDGYWLLYFLCFLFVFFMSFFMKYLVARWHWTKIQF